MDKQEPKVVAGFIVEQELQNDFIGKSFRGRRSPGQSPVRLLLLAPRWGSGEPQAARIRGLMQALSAVKSPALLRWLACQQLADKQLCVVSEWTNGQPFATWLQTASEPQLLESLRQIAAMLASAHAVGVAHCLLNPTQVTVSTAVYEAPQVHMHHLGLMAALIEQPTSADVDAAARDYLAPEQRLPGAALAALGAADVYALGVLAQRALARFRGSDQAAGPATLPDEVRAGRDFLSLLVRDNPAERPAMAAVASVLQRWAGHAAAPAMKNTQPNPALLVAAGPGGSPEQTRAQAPQSDRTERLPLTKIGNFRFTHELGAGGMGKVYEAVHEQIERRVAIKIMNPELARNPEFKERFLREARAANMVSHRCLVQITDFGSTEDGALYLVMEFLSGESLARRLERYPNGLAREQALQIAYDLARALSVLHAARIVHRDLKPENIMMVAASAEAGEQEGVKILDFGIAKMMPGADTQGRDLTEAGRTMGSPDFMAPEQFVGAGAVDAKADVFSLALIICLMISGKRPFSGLSWVMLNPDRAVPIEVPAGLPPRLRQMLVRMLAVEPAKRPTMAEVAQALKPRTLRRVHFLVGAVGLLAVGAVLAYQHRLPKPPPLVQDVAPYLTHQAETILTHQAETILRDGCRHPEPQIRKAAAKAVGRSGQPELGSLLISMLHDSAEEVRKEAGLAVARLAPPGALAELIHTAETPPLGEVQVEAAAALLRLGDQRGASILRSVTSRQHDKLYYLGALRLCEAMDSQGCRALTKLLDEGLSGINELEALYALAVSGDQRAVLLMQQRMTGAPSRLIQLGAANRLARLRGKEAAAGSARALLEQAAPRDLTAAVLAAQLQSDAGVALLARWVADSGKPPESRVLAAVALGDSGFIQRGLAALAPLISSSLPLDELRLSAAASLLLLASPGRQEDLAALSTLTGRSSLLAWLGDIQSNTAQAAVRNLSQLGRDERRMVAIELRRRALVQSIDVLMELLADVDPAVQIEGARSLKQILRPLMQQNAAFNRDAVLQRLHRMSASPRLVDQVVASSIRAQLGEPEAAAWTRTLYARSTEEPIRTLIINLAQLATDRELLVKALSDQSALVRFSAARRLAEAGDPQGQQVLLTDGLNSGGTRALIAYSLLVKLGVPVSNRAQALDWSLILNQESDLWVRYEGIVALASLRPADAVPLLRQCLSDPAAVVRRTIAYVAHQLFNKDALPELKEIVHHLLSDPELIVRIHAARLFQEMSAPSGSGLAAGPDLRAPDLTPAPAPDLGSPDLALPPAQRPFHASASPPTPGPLDMKLKEAAALEGKARQEEARLNYVEAIEYWDKILHMDPSPRLSETQRRARAATERLMAKVGRYRVHVWVNGQCVPEAAIHYERPGNFTIKRQNKSKVVQLLPGRLTEAKLCQ